MSEWSLWYLSFRRFSMRCLGLFRVFDTPPIVSVHDIRNRILTRAAPKKQIPISSIACEHRNWSFIIQKEADSNLAQRLLPFIIQEAPPHLGHFLCKS